VIAKALKNLTFLWSRGIIDKHEGIEMNKVRMQYPSCLVLSAQMPQDISRKAEEPVEPQVLHV
jgi:hypothetical protein